MKKLITIATLIIISAISAFAQTATEKEILKFIADYDAAYVNQDIAFAERVWADNYIFSYEGTAQNRAKSLEEARAEKAQSETEHINCCHLKALMTVCKLSEIWQLFREVGLRALFRQTT